MIKFNKANTERWLILKISNEQKMGWKTIKSRLDRLYLFEALLRAIKDLSCMIYTR